MPESAYAGISTRAGLFVCAGRLRYLRTLPHLKFVQLIGCILDEEDFVTFGKLKGLVRLNLSKTNVRDEWLKHLTGMASLSDLWLDETTISDAGLVHVAQMTFLDQSLNLMGTRITDKGLLPLAALVNLKSIHLAYTPVSDKGILPLAVIPRVSIYSHNNRVTEAGMDAFLAAQRSHRRHSAKVIPVAADPGDADVVAALGVMHSFFGAINEWEAAAVKAGSPDKEKIRGIFEEHCTSKPRTGFRPGSLSWGGPSEYAHPEKLTFSEILRHSKFRLEFFTHEWGGLKQRQRFVIMKKAKRWLLDLRQVWMSGGWVNAGL